MTLKTDATGDLKVFDGCLTNIRRLYFIHGHIHANFTDPSQRVTIVNQTQVINTFGYHLFEIEKG